MVRAAIVGMGYWGQSLVKSVQGKSDDIRFVVGATRTPDKAAAFAEKQGIRIVPRFEDVLASDDVDAVVLATPNSQHAAQVEQAAAAGKHVFVEKPFTLDYESARHALTAMRRAGLVLAVGYTRRFHPAMHELERRFRAGQLGTLISIVGTQTNMMAPYLVDHWRLDPKESPAGAMTANSVHTVDSMLQIAGPVAELHCVVEQRASAMEDTTSVLLRFVNGGTGLILGSMSSARFARFAVYGSTGLIEVTGSRLQTFEYHAAPTSAPTAPAVPTAPERIDIPGFDMLNAELIAFAECIIKRRPHPISDHDVLHGVAVLEAAAESARTGRPVAVRQEVEASHAA